jgi:2'-phosphotransferase
MSSTGEQALADQLQDAPPPQSRKSGGGGGGSRGGKGRSGGGQSRDVQVSKALSKLLRHDAVKAGLELDDEGFAGVGEVVSLSFLFFIGRGEER